MRIKEEEIAKVSSSELKKIEKILNKIEEDEALLIDEFDLNAEVILGRDLIDKLSKVSFFDEKTGSERFLFDGVSSREIKTIRGKVRAPYCGILTNVHKSFIDDSVLREEFEEKLRAWFSAKSLELQKKLDHKNTAQEVNIYVPSSYALASLALTSFHSRPNMKLYDVQKLTGIAISNGDIAELGTGEGKTLSGVLPIYLHALRGKGVHVVTANSYLAKRDYDEVSPIFYGLGLDIGFVPEGIEDLARIEGINLDTISYNQRDELEKKLNSIKKNAYASSITYGSKSAFAFDYLRDSTITRREDMIQREENPGFALIDEVDDILIDDAQCPYVLGGAFPVYKKDMSLLDLANCLNKPYEEVRNDVKKLDVLYSDYEKLDYETARYIALSLYSRELVPDQMMYQKRAQRYFSSFVKPFIYVVEDGDFGLTAPDLYEVLTNDEKSVSVMHDKNLEMLIKEEIEKIKKEASIIYYPDKKLYQVSDKCYNDFLTYCYAAFFINSKIKDNEEALLNDSNYVEGVDYNIVDDNVIMSFSGVKRLISDSNHPFLNDYNRYITLISPETSTLLHYFEQAIIANLLMKNLEDYVVQDGVVKVVNNGRIQDGSTYSNALHQAIEFKENIDVDKMTRENRTIATITQKDFYNRYDMFSGMTGTSSKKVFREVFGKNTVSIPRNAFYSYFSSRVIRLGRQSKNKPVGIEKKDTVFASSLQGKVNLIVDSVVKSLSMNPMQPVLLVVSNPLEMQQLDMALNNIGIKHSLLDVMTDKSKEAEIIAKAGLPGAVTISTQMAGRGTDIKLGGDRNTIIDIATERHIKKIEAKRKEPLVLNSSLRQILRNNVENALMNYKEKRLLWSEKEEIDSRESLSFIGLKVISSGYFPISRIDKQLEGRTGRNGMAGVCERFACPQDFEYLGINEIEYGKSIRDYFKSFEVDSNGALVVSEKDYDKLGEKIRMVQSNNESIISANIINSQELSRTATKIIEKYRDKRRQLLCGGLDIELELQTMFENTVDNLLMAYVVDGEISKDDLLSRFENCRFTLNFDALALEVKEVLGINMDINSVIENGLNLLELRNALLSTVISSHEEKKMLDPIGQLEKDKKALLLANDYAISNVPVVLSTSSIQKGLTSMSMGMENMADYCATIEFSRSFNQMQLESSKIAVKQLMGINLSLAERKLLEDRKREIFGYNIAGVENSSEQELIEPKSLENDGESVLLFQKISEPIEKKAITEIEKIEENAQKKLKDNPDTDISKLYSNLKIRPLKFVSSFCDSFDSLVLVRGNPILRKDEAKGNLFYLLVLFFISIIFRQ